MYWVLKYEIIHTFQVEERIANQKSYDEEST